MLKDLISEDNSPAITVATIMVVCSEYYGVSMEDLTGGSRSRVLVEARQIAMYLCVNRELPHVTVTRGPSTANSTGWAGSDLLMSASSRPETSVCPSAPATTSMSTSVAHW